jgi:hypothetical protein
MFDMAPNFQGMLLMYNIYIVCQNISILYVYFLSDNILSVDNLHVIVWVDKMDNQTVWLLTQRNYYHK